MSKEVLRRLELFAGLSEDDLDRLYRMSETLAIPAAATLIDEGVAADAMFVVLSGEFEVTKHSAKGEVVLARRGSGEVFGEMALLENAPRNASVRALMDSSVLKISRASFEQLVCSNTETMMAIMHIFARRLRSTETMLRQSEKMAALGTLAAGLAHELNNPAAAARRSVNLLRNQLTAWLSLAAQLDTLHLDERQVEVRSQLRESLSRRTAATVNLDPLARSDLEYELQDWLEQQGVSQAWEAAPVLISAGWTLNTLQQGTQIFSRTQLPVLLQWLAAGCTAYSLVHEVGVSAERISEMVKSVKEYTYLDRAPIQQVNVHDGLDSTLLIMKHKLKEGVVVQKQYATDPPRIEAYASELNQVWINLIDNAIDAMQGHGVLTLHTYPHDGEVAVEICDNGPGIPPDVLPRIFDSMFTTKAIGKGTGMGLHIARNIIESKHHGSIHVDSSPGHTCFTVLLPLKITRE